MEENLKQLLLKDICARLPYGVKIYNHLGQISTFYGIKDNFIFVPRCGRYGISYDDVDVEKIKLYLRPMSSMTEEERKEYNDIVKNTIDFYNCPKSEDVCFFITPVDFLNSIHVDYRGLIPKGLAIEAPEGTYSINN